MRKIILLCAAGMSTSMLVQRMKEAAAADGYECEIDAHPVAQASTVAADADIVLLGPQVRFQLAKVQTQVPCPVESIDMTAYGTMNGKAVIDHVREVLGE